jgi:beclin 1
MQSSRGSHRQQLTALAAGSPQLPPSPDYPPSSKPLYPTDRREYFDRATQYAGAPSYKRTVLRAPSSPGQPGSARSQATPQTPSTKPQNPAESFVVLTQSQVFAPPPSISRQSSTLQLQQDRAEEEQEHDQNALSLQVRRSEHLFEILSARTDIDYPMCDECSELLMEGFSKRLVNATRERDAFVDFLKKVKEEVPTAAEQEAQEKELRALEAEEEAALKELMGLEKERAEVEEEIHRLEEESRELDLEEEEFWRDRNAFTLQLEDFQNQRDGVNLQYDHDSKQLEKLQRTNVYNDSFNIGHDGYFGTINALRLGRLPNQPVLHWSPDGERDEFAYDFRLNGQKSMRPGARHYCC